MHILSFLSQVAIIQFSQTSKRHFQLSRTNLIWKHLVETKWDIGNLPVSIPSYYEFFKKRTTKETKALRDPVMGTGMEWEFQCPATMDKFAPTTDKNVNYCSVCKEKVYVVHNVEELNKRARANQCVSIRFDR
eukprot:Phypoly_transcript_05510.p1 GENE.Phypoly_transcript_05510~~Phypoly_transcript_05510.p1  ORF type:complete len:133 (+),score=17.71 Phypoly_transcript_05510:1437-1835(+)